MAVMVVTLLVGSGVALAVVKFGTEGRDVIRGTSGEDVIHGRGSWDVLSGRGADDVLFGEDGGDAVHGGSFALREIFEGRRFVPDGEDKLYGGDGRDCVYGGSEDDVLYGGAGSDFVGIYCLDFLSDKGNDVLHAGSGSDFVIASEPEFRREQHDIVFCGPGRDTVFYRQGIDRIFDCERRNPGL